MRNLDKVMKKGQLNQPLHQQRIAEALGRLLDAIRDYHAYSHPHLMGRANYQIQRFLAGLGRSEGEGPADATKEQYLEDCDLLDRNTFQWKLVPASGRVNELVVKTGLRDRCEDAEVELRVRIGNIEEWQRGMAATGTKARRRTAKTHG